VHSADHHHNPTQVSPFVFHLSLFMNDIFNDPKVSRPFKQDLMTTFNILLSGTVRSFLETKFACFYKHNTSLINRPVLKYNTEVLSYL
jgi:hypothetical protein